MSEIQKLIAYVDEALVDAKKYNEHLIPIHKVYSIRNELERLTQQLPSDSGRTASEVNRDVQSAALVIAELRARTVREQNKHFANMIEFEQSNPPHLGLLWHLSQTSLQMATKFSDWLDDMIRDHKEAVTSTDASVNAAD